MVTFEQFTQHIEDALVDELKGLLDAVVDNFTSTGVLELPEVEDAVAILKKSPGRVLDAVVIALIKDAIRESVEKVFLEKYGRPKSLSGNPEKWKVDLVNMIIYRVYSSIVEKLNALIGAALAGPLGLLASLVASSYEEVLLEEILKYNGPVILEGINYIEETVPAGAVDPMLADPIHVDINLDNEQLGQAITNSIDLSGWTEREIQVWRDSGFKYTAQMQRQAIANVQSAVQKTQQTIQSIAAEQQAKSSPLLAGVRENPFSEWETPTWQDEENYHQQVRYRTEEGDYSDLLNANLY